MKTTAIMLLTLFPALTWALQVSYTNNSVPFACNDSASVEIATKELSKSCQEHGMILTEANMASCEDNGGDGGYVEYYAVTFVGTCSTR